MIRPRVAILFDKSVRPETTGTYCHRALQAIAEVVYFSIDQLHRVPRFGFDLYLSIDDGLRYRLPPDLRPCAWWAIDTHMDLDWAIERGRDFDWLFAAQKDGCAQLIQAGLPAVWLPLGCDPTIHRPIPTTIEWDVCFIGRISPGPRHELLQLIADRFPRSFIGQRYFDEYARTCSASLVGFNRSVKNDVNMRVFETLACGPLLITNDLSENGQADLFLSDHHFVTYREPEELVDKLRFYTRSQAERERIAVAGHFEVVQKHTYRHRMQTLLEHVENDLARTHISASRSLPMEQPLADRSWIDSIDFVIKTFLRPSALLRILSSIQRHFPAAQVTVADDGDLRSGQDSASLSCCTLIDSKPQFQLLELPFGSGVSAGRNHLVENTTRPFLLFLDDDFFFTADTRIDRLLDRLVERSDLGVVAGACIDIVDGNRHLRRSGGTLDIVNDDLIIRSQDWRDEKRGVREYFPQFAMYRREIFRDVRWEGGIGAEHYDFCMQLMRSKWKAAQDMSVLIEHYPQTETLPRYTSFRHDYAHAQQWLLQKWNLQRIIQDGTTVVELDAPPSQSRPTETQTRPQKDTPYFEFARPEVVALIPSEVRRLLDIGCGSGRLGELLKQRQVVEVTGLELNPGAAIRARKRLDRVLELDVEHANTEFSVGAFDCVVCADVLEHLREPADTLAKIRRWLVPGGHLVISVPNVRHHSVVSGLLEGNWTYEAAGLLDNDHVRFFTRREIEKLLFRCGFDIVSQIAKPGPGYGEWVSSGRPGAVQVGALNITGLSSEDAEEFFTYQFLITAKPMRSLRYGTLRASLLDLKNRFPWPSVKPHLKTPEEHLGWCSPAAYELLKEELQKPTTLVLELGAWLGMSTRIIADLTPDAQVITVDHWQGSPEHHRRPEWAAMLPHLFETFMVLTWEYRDRVTPLKMTTLEGIQTVAALNLVPDLVFIDAEHSYEAVSNELGLCHQSFPTARLIGDDFDEPDVQRAVSDFAKRIGASVRVVGTGWRAWSIDARRLPLTRSDQSDLTSIIIVTYNELAYTKECIDSIRLRTDEPYELIFVDNGSTDGTPEFLDSISGARVIRNPINRGFPAAVNQAIPLARGKQILLLNNDTVVSTGWLTNMLRVLERDPKSGLVGPCSNQVSGSQMIPVSYQDMSSMDGFAWDHAKRYSGVTEETDRLIGFCLLIRATLISEVGNLDERFGVGCFEDDDYCVRARRAGWKAVIARDAFVHHYGSRTFAASGIDYAELISKNQQRFRDKWNPVPGDANGGPDPKRRFTVKRADEGGLLLEPLHAPRLSLCMIVRNNENTIGPCISSIRPWVDEMIVIDTGSTDATATICKDLGAKVWHWPWQDDFSAARNESLKYASGEWIFWMDSDDTITEDCGQKLRSLAYGTHSPEVLGYIAQVHCPGPSDQKFDITVVDHVKLFRNRPDLRFEHRIHEQILPAIRRAGGDVAFTDIYVVHSGADHTPEGRQRKLVRDFKLLHLDLAERPDHPFVLFNLGMTHADTQDHREAIRWLTKCLEVSGPNESHVRKTYALLVNSLMQAQEFERAATTCERGRQLFPDDKELQFRHAMIAHQLGWYTDAISLYTQVLAPSSDRYFVSVDQGLSTFKARHNLALVYEDARQPDLAEREWRKILVDLPDYLPARLGLIDCLLRRSEFDEADHNITRLSHSPAAEVQRTIMRVRLIEAQGGPLAAIQLGLTGLQESPDNTELLRELGRLLHVVGDFPQACEILTKLTSLSPNDPTAWHNFGVILSLLNRKEEAESAFAAAATLRSTHNLELSHPRP